MIIRGATPIITEESSQVELPPPLFFAAHVGLETDDCVRWPFVLNSDGYGKLKVSGRFRYVHQLACEGAHGPRPDGMEVAHSCRNRNCFNPRHLSWKTHRDNQADKLRDGTLARGEKNPHAKLTETAVREIRQRHAGGEDFRQLAQVYAVEPSTIRHAIQRRTWAWLT